MRIHYETIIIIKIILIATIQNVSPLPFIFGSTAHNGNRRQIVEWQQPSDEWNITTLPRSITPHLNAKNYSASLHVIPTAEVDVDEDTLAHLREIKVMCSLTCLLSLSLYFSLSSLSGQSATVTEFTHFE